jgi:hypothetical protein
MFDAAFGSVNWNVYRIGLVEPPETVVNVQETALVEAVLSFTTAPAAIEIVYEVKAASVIGTRK